MSIIGSGIAEQFGSDDLRLRELERRAPALNDSGTALPCEGAIKLYNANNQTVPGSAFSPYRLIFTGSMYACTASPLVSGDGFQVERDGVWHVTCTVHASTTVDGILEIWTDHGTNDFIIASDELSAAETGSDSRYHASQDVFLNYGDTVWAVMTPQAATSMNIIGEPMLGLAAHLVACDCSTSCNWVQTCAGWTINCT